MQPGRSLGPTRRSSWIEKPDGVTNEACSGSVTVSVPAAELIASVWSASTGPTGSHHVPPWSIPLKIPQWPSVYGVAPIARPGADDGSTEMKKPSSRVVANVPSAATLRWTLMPFPSPNSIRTSPSGRANRVVAQRSPAAQKNDPTWT
jgi:hypothetical protein